MHILMGGIFLIFILYKVLINSNNNNIETVSGGTSGEPVCSLHSTAKKSTMSVLCERFHLAPRWSDVKLIVLFADLGGSSTRFAFGGKSCT